MTEIFPDECIYCGTTTGAHTAPECAADGPQHQQVESTPVRLPKPGDYLLVVPAGADENPQAWWTAELVGYTPDGQLRVRSTRPDATTVQTVNNVRSI